MAPDTKKPSLKRGDFLSLLMMLGAAFVVSYIPVLHWPLTWMQTFFHEISHGLAAFLTGGWIVNIELNLDGSGWCVSAKGMRFITSFSGYFGAVIWGTLIYSMANNSSPKSADKIAMVILGLVGLTALLWARDFVTWGILGFIAAPFIIILKTKEFVAENFFMRFAGIYILLDAIKSPLNLLGHETGGDAATLAELTFIPQFVWVFIWLSIGKSALVFLAICHAEVPEEAEVVEPSMPSDESSTQVLSRAQALLKKIKKHRS